MARQQLTRDLLSDPDDEREHSSEDESEVDQSEPQSAQDRKREALYTPISSICAALGGQEEFKDKDGSIYKEYSLGDQVIGKHTLTISPALAEREIRRARACGGRVGRGLR